jgi:integrase
MGKRRHFGNIRRLPSGRYQARYSGPDGRQHAAPWTFERKREAETWLASVQAELARGDWLDLAAGRVQLTEYARAWVEERPLSPTTRERYEFAMRLHVLPILGGYPLVDISEAAVRRWRKALIDAGTGTAAVAKAYRTLRAILNTAVDDGLIRRNPCRIKGGGDDKAPERPIISVDDIFRLADTIGPRYRALVLLATFASLRFGELAALRRSDIDLARGLVRITRAQIETSDGTLDIRDPKTPAGKRTVAIPAVVVPDLRAHLDWFADRSPDTHVFVGPQGGRLRRSNFRKLWVKACQAAHLPADLHFHDLRHTGNTLAAATGASVKELMTRMGHASPRAAMIYQHATSERDRLIADALNDRIVGARSGDHTTADGSADASVPAS